MTTTIAAQLPNDDSKALGEALREFVQNCLSCFLLLIVAPPPIYLFFVKLSFFERLPSGFLCNIFHDFRQRLAVSLILAR